MKTAEERAAELAAMPGSGTPEVVRALKEYGRDQRIVCASAVTESAPANDSYEPVDVLAAAESAALNAPAPGEQKP